MEELQMQLRQEVVVTTQAMSIVVSVIFTLVFGYLAGLYYFLRQTMIFVRIVSFFCFSATFLWLVITGLSFFAANLSWADQVIHLIENKALPEAWTMERAVFNRSWVVTGLNWYLIANVLVYIGLLILTFGPRWGRLVAVVANQTKSGDS